MNCYTKTVMNSRNTIIRDTSRCEKSSRKHVQEQKYQNELLPIKQVLDSVTHNTLFKLNSKRVWGDKMLRNIDVS